MKAISLCSKSLKVLRLCDYYPMIKLNAMPQIAELVNLETLDVSQNVLVRDEFLIAIGAQCKQLTNVDVSCKYSHCFNQLFYLKLFFSLQFVDKF